MFYDERKHKVPHVHAKVAGKTAVFNIKTAQIMVGSLPAAKEDLIRGWIRIHRADLLSNWERAKKGEKLASIPPLR